MSTFASCGSPSPGCRRAGWAYRWLLAAAVASADLSNALGLAVFGCALLIWLVVP